MIAFSKVQRVMMALGVASVVAAVPLAHARAATNAYPYVTTTSMHMPAIISMFMHKKVDSTSTTTIGPTRTRVDASDGTSTIIACDTQQMINIDNNKKTYSASSFDDLMKKMSADMNAALAKSKNGSPPPAVNGTGDVTVSFDEKPDTQTAVIAGITAHHAVDTVTIATTGTGECAKAMSTSMSFDIWYAPLPYKMSCPVRPKMQAMPQPQGGSASPCMQNFQIQANQKATGGRLALRTTTSFGMKGQEITTTTEVKSAGLIPYNASFFEPPAGYAKVDPPSTTP